MDYLKMFYKNSFLFLLFLISSFALFSQNNSAIAPELNTKGLLNEEAFRNIFTGNFAALDFNREQPEFSFLFDGYITAYFINCGNNLPDDKAEIIINDKHTGVFTTPAMLRAEAALTALQKAVDPSETAMSTLQSNNPLGTVGDYMLQPRVVKQDMKQLFSINECKSAGIKRFGQNLYAFAMNMQPVVLEGSNISRPDPKSLLKDQNLDKLINDLVYDQSKSWKIYQYIPNSVTYAKIISKDNEGRPAKVSANYGFRAGNQRLDGSVTVTFSEGLPGCLYFDDQPIRCRTASWKIVMNYARGNYVSTLYTIDKAGADWKMIFTNAQYIRIHTGNGDSVKDLNVGVKSLVIIKPGQCLEYRTFDDKLGFPEWTMIKEADHRSLDEKKRNPVPRAVENVPAYTTNTPKADVPALNKKFDEVIKIDAVKHDFGKIKQSCLPADSVTAYFGLTNTYDKPLALIVQCGCGCLTSGYKGESIAPNTTYKLKISLNPCINLGTFQKSVSIRVAGVEQPKIIYLTGQFLR